MSKTQNIQGLVLVIAMVGLLLTAVIRSGTKAQQSTNEIQQYQQQVNSETLHARRYWIDRFDELYRRLGIPPTTVPSPVTP